MNCRILVLDDHPLIRVGLQQILSTEPGFEFVAACGSPEQAIEILQTTSVDLIVTDLQFPGTTAVPFIQQVTTTTSTRVLVSSAYRADVFGPICLAAGADRFVSKQLSHDALMQEIRLAASPRVASLTENDRTAAVVSNPLIHPSSLDGPEGLSDREWEVFNLIGHGMNTVEMAKSLHVSAKTIESHRLAIKRKLGVASKDRLISIATEWCMVNASAA